MLRARIATRADVPALATALAGAFRSDPLWHWMVGDLDRWDVRAAGAFAAEAAVKVRYGHTYTTDDRAGAALWAPPGTWKGTLGDARRVALPMLRLTGGVGARRGLGVLRACERAHPPSPDHWYLAVLGTHPDHQGRGVGSALLRPVLERCDLDGTGAYLESSKPENVAFYERHGFRATDTITPGGSPPLTLMWRDPRPVEAP
ncbi:GNAT family N-acetyltransferase [Iamia sp. SCSIO 61187]|uniref:GNAT family N-acetyltransferase n=1 Tax=Iamia sp. SCSIO 61187 TaxID=2722752 RepID=UPI001C639915|nr:GNAT family N-acetyltransferase [Iamia sp. SCSIO 61187]QYG93485.1 GNAT family N-acetyltransferase [Iamia sp. SCSIO 61187]